MSSEQRSGAVPLWRTGLRWWRWSALAAVAVGGIEAVCLLLVALSGDIEFGVMAMYFVGFATLAAVPATGVLIFVWLLLLKAIPGLSSHPAWLVAFILLFTWPLLMAPISLNEFAVAVPTLLGFIVPRFAVGALANGSK